MFNVLQTKNYYSYSLSPLHKRSTVFYELINSDTNVVIYSESSQLMFETVGCLLDCKKSRTFKWLQVAVVLNLANERLLNIAISVSYGHFEKTPLSFCRCRTHPTQILSYDIKSNSTCWKQKAPIEGFFVSDVLLLSHNEYKHKAVAAVIPCLEGG